VTEATHPTPRPNQGPEPAELALAIQRGEKGADNAFVKRFTPGLLTVLRVRCSDEELCRDLTQEALRIVLLRLRGPGLEDPAGLAGFLRGTALNLLANELRRSGAQGEVHFELKSDTQLLNDLNHMLSSLLLFTPLSEDAAHQFTTAVREMGVIAMEWGHRKRVELVVTVKYRIAADRVIVTVKDTGPGFNRENLAHAADLEDPTKHIDVRESLGLRVGGFGILMARGLVDDLTYNEIGNEVSLVKRFAKSRA
jgi:anti-sigma regulatory factor (Ser/Thr protein kinase)